jgi:hypothetical protein
MLVNFKEQSFIFMPVPANILSGWLDYACQGLPYLKIFYCSGDFFQVL